MKKVIGLSLLLTGLLVTGLWSWGQATEPPTSQVQDADKGPDATAVERSRKQVKMLDDIYKTTVVLITDKYVNDEDDFPAGSAAIALFNQVSEKGWHGVRLIDATGDPYDDANVAKNEFEKEGIRRLNGGKDYYEQVVEVEGKPMLRAMTAVPVVMDKCVMCHPHYEDVKEGAAIGAISYEIPIE